MNAWRRTSTGAPRAVPSGDELLGLLPLLDTVMPYELDGVPTPDPQRAIDLARVRTVDRD
ncbi:hypothetical protein ACIHCQ_34755 [Streptomyces sp. NPDC052236]|uniref:hypothetical protein n=1 Tax=Streptomyces sp. NPDC052236 TaxID=3365686 RepID=UPI0037D7AE4A